MTESTTALRAKLLAMAITSLGVASGCGGGAESTTPTETTAATQSTASAGGETATEGSANCGAADTATPTSTETPAGQHAGGNTDCGHGACG